MLSVVELDWLLILSLIFGGCCSNAYYLELSTQALPSCGTILTISQFFFTAFFSLSSQLFLKDLNGTGTAAEGGKVKGQQGKEVANGAKNVHQNGDGNEEVEQRENVKPGLRISQLKRRNQKQRYMSTASNSTSSFNKDNSSIDSSSLSTLSLLSIALFSPLELSRLRWKKPSVPLSRWSVQVVLYLATSLLNNTAFAYQIPMAVHIIFRSGGLVINMGLGWAIGRKYTPLQVFSVFLVTFGVCLATLSTSPSPSPSSSSSSSSLLSLPPYTIGVLLLTLALLLSGLMGLYQERTYAKYGSDQWREGLFYGHALSLPLFILRKNALIKEWNEALDSRKVWIGWGKKMIVPDAPFTKSSLDQLEKGWDVKVVFFKIANLIPILNRFNPFVEDQGSSSLNAASANPMGFIVPLILPLLLLNVATQLLCINGVNRLTARVTSLTVTLVLVVRKALSLAISVVLVGGGTGNLQLWAGSGAVLAGTIGYSLGGSKKQGKEKDKEGEKDDKEGKKQVEEEEEEEDPWSQAGRTFFNGEENGNPAGLKEGQRGVGLRSRRTG